MRLYFEKIKVKTLLSLNMIYLWRYSYNNSNCNNALILRINKGLIKCWFGEGDNFLTKLFDSKFWHPSFHTDFYSRIIQRSFWKKMWGLHQFSWEPLLILWYSNNSPSEELILLSSLLFFSSLIVNWPNTASYSFAYGTVLQNHFQWLHKILHLLQD